ncbi:MAG: hypothetical protein ABI986_11615 [Chloroflexota bacterium]
MKSTKSLLNCSIGFVILLVGSVIFLRVLGNRTSANSFVTECQLTENNAIVRLYEVHGSSVTTSDSWSVTYQEPSSIEKTIFSAYSSPGVKNIKCKQSEVILVFYPGDYQESLSLDWIQNELVHKPLSFYKSHLKTPEYWDNVSDWKYIMRY